MNNSVNQSDNILYYCITYTYYLWNLSRFGKIKINFANKTFHSEKKIEVKLVILTILFFFLIAEDQKLNTHVFHWPDHIKNVFEIAQKIILSKRDSIEDELRNRTSKFEDKLNDMLKEVESFKKKEVCFLLMKRKFKQ